MKQTLTATQQRALKKLAAGPVPWSKATMAEADAFEVLVTQGLAVKTVVHDGLRPATGYQLPEANLCKCRYHADSDAVAGAAELQKSLDPEQFSVLVVDGPCENPLYVCAGISDVGTH